MQNTERLQYQYGTHYLTMYLHTYLCIVDFLMLNWTTLGYEFFSLHCQRRIHSTMKALYKLGLYVLNILALLIHEDDSTILC